MRILLAIDGSSAAGRARDLLASLRLPPESAIRIVAVYESPVDVLGMTWPTAVSDEPAARKDPLRRRLEDALDTAVRSLSRPGLKMDRILQLGRPASAIVDEAREFAADLIVVGNRGHGTLEALLLGSVSSEVVDHAPCPVLVARTEAVAGIVLAADGSAGAEHAAAFLDEWPILADRPLTVVSVAEVDIPWSVGMAPGLYDQVMESYSEQVDEARRQRREIADRTADRLRRVGYRATVDVREGDAAGEIIAAAQEHGANLIVTGTRGHTGLTRLLLGSVARKVLHHAPGSVLVVREQAKTARFAQRTDTGDSNAPGS